ncbi:MAG: urease accessory protein UreE [Ethanoligenens sp.]
MLSNGVIGNMQTLDVQGRRLDHVQVEWFDAEKQIIKLTSTGGCELGVRQPHGARIQDGDVLYADDAMVIAAHIKPCVLLRVRLTDVEQAARVGYELGNRHLPVVVANGVLEVPYDEPTAQYLEKRGFTAERVEGIFHGSAIAHHHHHHGK